MRWSRFKNLEAKEMFEVVTTKVFPFIKELRGEESSYARHMKDARFTIPTPGLLAKVVDLVDHVPMEDRDTKGDVYEYMLGKIATAGQNGQFRTPRHIIQLMVEMCKPQPKDIICDPACGTAGFLVMAGENLREHHPEIFTKESLRKHFNEKLFNGYDFDNTMLRIGSMKLRPWRPPGCRELLWRGRWPRSGSVRQHDETPHCLRPCIFESRLDHPSTDLSPNVSLWSINYSNNLRIWKSSPLT